MIKINMNLDPYLTLYTKTNLKWIIPNIRTKIIKLLEGKIRQ